MLYRDGIVAWFEGGDGVVARGVRAGHEMGVAVDIGYNDLRVGNRGFGRIKDNACDAAGADLPESARPR